MVDCTVIHCTVLSVTSVAGKTGWGVGGGVGVAQLVERLTRGQKVAGSIPGRNGGNVFFFRVNFLC